MPIAARILANTPVWVFLLLAYLVWQGLQGLRPRTQPIWRMLIVPLVFFLMGLSRLIASGNYGLEALLAWLMAAVLFASLALYRGPRLLAADRTSGKVTRPGSAIPLVRNITVFTLQYGVAVATAMKLEPHATWRSSATPSPAPARVTFPDGPRRCYAVTGISVLPKTPTEARPIERAQSSRLRIASSTAASP